MLLPTSTNKVTQGLRGLPPVAVLGVPESRAVMP